MIKKNESINLLKTFLIIVLIIISIAFVIIYSGIFNFQIADSKISKLGEVVKSNDINEYDEYFKNTTILKFNNNVITYNQARVNIEKFINKNNINEGNCAYTPYSEIYKEIYLNKIKVGFLADFDTLGSISITGTFKCNVFFSCSVVELESISDNFGKIFFGIE